MVERTWHIVLKPKARIQKLEHFSMGVIIDGEWLRTMDNLTQQVQENEEEDVVEGVPVCGANFVSPVTDTANFIRQVHYRIGTRLYIEHAD
jgi:hypothetical protein